MSIAETGTHPSRPTLADGALFRSQAYVAGAWITTSPWPGSETAAMSRSRVVGERVRHASSTAAGERLA